MYFDQINNIKHLTTKIKDKAKVCLINSSCLTETILKLWTMTKQRTRVQTSWQDSARTSPNSLWSAAVWSPYIRISKQTHCCDTPGLLLLAIVFMWGNIYLFRSITNIATDVKNPWKVVVSETHRKSLVNTNWTAIKKKNKTFQQMSF